MKSVIAPEGMARVLQSHGMSAEVFEFPQSTRTAAEAAAAIGCEVGAIGKSLLFMTREGGKPLLVIASGSARVDEKKFAAFVGEEVRKAQAEEVKAVTGYSIGGVPPFGHAQKLDVFIDESLQRYETIWVAAGSPFTVMPFAPTVLQEVAAGKWVSVQ